MRKKIGGRVSANKNKKVIYPIDFVEFDFEKTLRICSHIKDLTFQGNTFIGVGALGKVDEVSEKSDLSARGAKFTMAGVDPSFVSLIMQGEYRGKIVKRWLGFVDSGDEVLNDGYLLGVWRVDTMNISTGKEAQITITAENRFLRAAVVRNERYTNEAQQAKYPTDKGLEFVEQAAKDEW